MAVPCVRQPRAHLKRSGRAIVAIALVKIGERAVSILCVSVNNLTDQRELALTAADGPLASFLSISSFG